MLKRLLLYLILIVPLHSFATHLLGGEITYKHVSYNAGTNTNTYKIQVNMYRDCQYGQALLDDTIDIGFYEKVSGSKRLSFMLQLGPPDSSNVDPFSGADYKYCKKLPVACMQVGNYYGNIDLPVSNYGYDMLYVRCCRKNGVINILDSQGQSYTNFIPPNTIVNSSPYFTDPPAPFLGVNDTASYFNNAIDPDGDSLVYSLARPYTGASASVPATYPAATYAAPGLIKYQPTYSFAQPFGPSGFATIDPVTGLTTIYATKTGNYAIAIDVSEYRNGTLIATTRRDVMLYITSVLSTVKIKGDKVSWYVTSDSFAVQAGTDLKFDLEFSGGDTLGFTASGEPMNSPHNATFTTTNFTKMVRSDFNWQTTCSDLRSQPYIINYTVTNKWCPPSIPLKGTKRIYVIPFKGVDTIFGPNIICSNNIVSAMYYIHDAQKGYNYTWIPVGGTEKTESTNDDSVYIDWGKSTKGSITLRQSNAKYCPGDTIKLNVTILPPPTTPILSGKLNVCANEIDSYYVTNYDTGSTLYWSVSGGKMIKNSTAYALIKWSNNDSGIISVVNGNLNRCKSDTERLTVIKNVATADSIAGAYSVCPNARGIDYYIYRNVTPGSVFKWFVTGGTIASGNNSSHITVNWGNKGKGKVQALEYTKYGCVGDTLNFNVTKEYAFITGPIKGDTSLCEFTSGEKYSALYVHNSTYTWTISGGTLVSANGVSSATVNWGSAGSASVTVSQTAYDSVNNLPCIAKDVILPVTLHPIPNTGNINGDQTMCEGFKHVYSVAGLPGSTFIWAYTGGNSNISRQGNDTVSIDITTSGNYTITVQEVSRDSCFGTPVSYAITVLPSPKMGKINGPLTVCAPNLNNITYAVNTDAGAVFNWSVLGGIINSGNGTNSVNINWQTPGFDSLSVIETNTYGCKDTQSVNVEEDSAEIDMQLVTTIRQNEQQIELFWTTKNAQFLKGKLQVLRRGVSETSEVIIDTVGKYIGHYIDKRAQPSQTPYFYRLLALNNCLSPVSSDTHKTVFLHGNISSDTVINLGWNSYVGWNKNIKEYKILRSFNTDSALFDAKHVPDTSTQLFSDRQAWRQCFRIAAVNAIDTGKISYSNSVCFEFEPLVYLPNVFTPNGNSLNDYFQVFVTNWKAFDLNIYDRWGEKLFHSNDPAIQWDGTYKGEKCAEGVYIYFLTVDGIHTTTHKKGTITILR